MTLEHTENAIKNLKKSLNSQSIPFLENEPMCGHISFCIGGAADIFCQPKDAEQLLCALRCAKEQKVPSFILGMGSNVLFSDEGFRGIVVSTLCALSDVSVQGAQICAGAGVDLAHLCDIARRNGLGGLEFAYGIPGSVGGAVFMNAGAYGGEVKDVLHSVTFLDEELCEVTLPCSELALGYRSSAFQGKSRCVLSATFELKAENSAEISLKMEQNMLARKQKQPLELPSAGSAFKRPVGAFAGALIDECGLRGYRVGGAAVSEKHCGFIVNLGGASCADVLNLAEHVQEVVQKEKGFVLEREFRMVSEQDDFFRE